MVLGSKIPEGIGLILETYRSGHNGPDSKSVGRRVRIPPSPVKRGCCKKKNQENTELEVLAFLSCGSPLCF